MFGSVVAQGQRGIRETVASEEQGARTGSREHGAWSRAEIRNAERPTQKSVSRKRPATRRFAQRLEQRKDRPMEEKRKTLSARLARWAAELVLVFIGVYAAFWLNSYQQHQQEANRRDQILASLERILRQGIESGKINAAQ